MSIKSVKKKITIFLLNLKIDVMWNNCTFIYIFLLNCLLLQTPFQMLAQHFFYDFPAANLKLNHKLINIRTACFYF